MKAVVQRIYAASVSVGADEMLPGFLERHFRSAGVPGASFAPEPGHNQKNSASGSSIGPDPKIMVSSCGAGLIVYLGVEKGDTEKAADELAGRIAKLRIISDSQGKMNLSVLDTQQDIMLISQFTLCADNKSGNRPGFSGAEVPARANELYEYFACALRGLGIRVATGVFGADMTINQSGDGPVTILLSSKNAVSV